MTNHFQNLLDTLDHTTTVLTVNRRIARSLRLVYDAKRTADGLLSWETPDVLPLSAWVQRSWEEFSIQSEIPLPVLLSPSQEHALWERVIRETVEPNGAELLQISQMAQDAKRAWERIKGWRIPDRAYQVENNDTKIFSRWVSAFSHLCSTYHWIDPASASDQLILAVRTKKIHIRSRIVLMGFEEFTPQQQDLLNTLDKLGTEISPRTLHAPSPLSSSLDGLSGGKIRLSAQEQELECAARWARALLEKRSPGPIGVIIPKLTGIRPAVLRTFDEILCPEAKDPHVGMPLRPFELSLGRPLIEVPPIRDAILALTLVAERHPVPAFSRLLLSPYFLDAETQFTARAQADVSIRAIGEPWLTLSTVCDHLEASSEVRISEDQPAPARKTDPNSRQKRKQFHARLQGILVALQKLPARRTLTDWAQTFADWLAHLGWPERIPDGEEHQAITAFYELLAELAGLTLVLTEQSLHSALLQLRQMATMHIFQPESNPTPIRIMGMSETAGLRFTHLWIIGLDAESWPPAPRPNPFLPIALQRRAGMPHGSPEIELSRARRAICRMLASADKIIVSYPQGNGEIARHPSPLITMLPEIQLHEIPQSQSPSAIRHVRSGTDPHDKAPLLDETGPAIRRGEPMTGGTRIWRDQAACPFRAFATHRLGAVGLETPAIGLDYAMRGIVVHRALELIWRKLQCSDRLISMADATLRTRVSEAVGQALMEAAKRRPETFRNNRLRTLEETRLNTLVMTWLEQEKKRPPFTVVVPARKRVALFGILSVVICPDRIDRTRDGQCLLLDYKTTDIGIGNWFGEHPADPQLPLYAIAEESDGITFAFVRRGRVDFEGIADFPGIAPGIETLDKTKNRAAKEFRDWDTLCGEWRRILVLLAQSFAQGDTRVDPKSPETCRNCNLHSLCRIYARGTD
uniref:Probable DNA repair protein n=1 Tax=Candidatus Kentrum sp. TUN TaxID=2126343 RepID=A0A451AN81_9GAMM|nr:MAG: probable DNA repair protein [Candidatus Kentron sp. TUN]VFK67503.1 MAG: probable DNA repair protein [Candidatus Kentron sp. TUN]